MISVIIPNYNKSNYIIETIDSLKKQSTQNWECKIIDDKSTDQSYSIIKKKIITDFCSDKL